MARPFAVNLERRTRTRFAPLSSAVTYPALHRPEPSRCPASFAFPLASGNRQSCFSVDRKWLLDTSCSRLLRRLGIESSQFPLFRCLACKPVRCVLTSKYMDLRIITFGILYSKNIDRIRIQLNWDIRNKLNQNLYSRYNLVIINVPRKRLPKQDLACCDYFSES